MTVKEDMRVKPNPYLSFYYQQSWETILNASELKKETTVVNLKSGLSQTYVGNFYSLLSNEYSVPMMFWYPFLRANGLTNSMDYDGKTDIVLINGDYLERNYKLIKIDMDKKREVGMVE